MTEAPDFEREVYQTDLPPRRAAQGQLEEPLRAAQPSFSHSSESERSGQGLHGADQGAGVLNDFDRQREKIGRQLEEGYLTPTEHRRISRAIQRAEAKQERHNSRLVLRRSLLRSLGRQSA